MKLVWNVRLKLFHALPTAFDVSGLSALYLNSKHCKKPLFIFPDSFKAYRTNVIKGSTEEIRSCTAGLVFDKKSEAPLFFHIYDDSSNINNLSVIEPYMKGENAILIGSRTKFKKSRELFKAIEKMLDAKSIPMTVFEDF